MRKLVTVRTVRELSPIPDADRIEIAHVDGWQCVVKKGEFKVGDEGVYFEIDSFLPDTPTFAFLKTPTTFEGKKGYRLRSVRLRGALSQGLLLPMSSVPEVMQAFHKTRVLNADGSDPLDLAAVLGVVKYEPPIPACLGGKVIGGFPSFIHKTDQERIQNMPDVLNDKDTSYEETIKLDGTSMTVYYNDGVVGVCGRNWEYDITDMSNSLVRVAHETGIIDVLKLHGENIALQGELIGEGIQGNKEKIRGQAFYVFDIFDINAHRYLTAINRHWLIFERFVAYGFKLNHVPILSVHTLLGQRFKTVDEVLKYAEGPSLNKETNREGIVFKATKPDRYGRIKSFKAISNSFLLENGE